MACMKAAVSGEYAQEPGVVMKSSLVYSSVRCHQGAGGSEGLLLPSGKHHRGWRVKSTQRLGKRVTGSTKKGWTRKGERLGKEAKESADDSGAMGADTSGN